MLICRNAEGVHGQRKPGNPCSGTNYVVGRNKSEGWSLHSHDVQVWSFRPFVAAAYS